MPKKFTLGLPEKVSSLRKASGLTQTELAEKCGLSLRTISRIEVGRWNGGKNTIQKIGNYFDVDPEWLLSDDEFDPSIGEVATYHVSIKNIPVFETLPSGLWTDWTHDLIDKVKVDTVRNYELSGEYLFAVRVADDSMSPMLHRGDLVIANPQKAFISDNGGRIGLVKNGNRAVPRKVFLSPDGNSYLLEPENKSYNTSMVPVTGTTIYKIVAIRKDIDDLC